MKLKLSDFNEFPHGDKVIVSEMDRRRWLVHLFYPYNYPFQILCPSVQMKIQSVWKLPINWQLQTAAQTICSPNTVVTISSQWKNKQNTIAAAVLSRRKRRVTRQTEPAAVRKRPSARLLPTPTVAGSSIRPLKPLYYL